MNIFVFGSSIISSYWNGAATYYRGIYKYLARRGHHITFAEPDAYGRQQHRDQHNHSYVGSIVYRPTIDVPRMLNYASHADVVIKHSGLGVDDEFLECAVTELQTPKAVIFWDVDAPATIARIEADAHDPFRQRIRQYNAIFTYGGGPEMQAAYLRHGAQSYCSIYNGLDPDTHHPVAPDPELACDVVFIGNRLPDRERRVEELFFRAAVMAPDKRFLLGGEGWGGKPMPANVRWIGHVPTHDHNRVNCSAGMVLNINRSSMANCGFSPPTRVFEVAGAGACMLCDDWPGIDDCFKPEEEILVIRTAQDIVTALDHHNSEARKQIGRAFRDRALRDHTYARRAEQAEYAIFQICERRSHARSEPVGEAIQEAA